MNGEAFAGTVRREKMNVHATVNVVNSEHKSDCVNLAFSLQKNRNKRPQNQWKEREQKSEWWPLTKLVEPFSTHLLSGEVFFAVLVK